MKLPLNQYFMKYSARKISQCKNSYFYGTPPVAASGSIAGFMVFCKKFTGKHKKKEKRDSSKGVFL